MSGAGKGQAEFVAEATEILETLGKDLMVLEDLRGKAVDPDPDRINGIFRGAHSLKGLAGMFGVERVAALAHLTEDLLDRLRMGKVALTGEVLDALGEAVEVLQRLVAQVAKEDGQPLDSPRARALATRLEALAIEGAGPSDDPLEHLDLDPQVRAVFTEYEEHRLRENVRKGVGLFKVRASFDISDFDQGLTALNAKLKPAGEVISTLPSAEPDGGSGIAFDLIFGTREARETILGRVEGLPVAVTEIPRRGGAPAVIPLPVEVPAATKPKRARAKKARPAPRVEESLPAATPLPEAPESLAREPEATLRSPTQTVRVDIRRLDALMNTVGELLLIKGNLQRLAEGARLPGVLTLSKLWAQDLTRESRQLERKLDELQTGLLEARMVPLGQVFDKLSRLVRRIAREAGKELDFFISGGEVELDKLIVEELSDPLMHIIRNAIDHGVERPDVRERNGKPRRAALGLKAMPKGNQVVIEVTDDGAGIDVARVREVARERGLISRREAAEMDDRDVQNLIFLPGFSTARSVSALSGRGVGLDVVKTNIAHLSGLIDVTSAPGQGTTFRITLPVTLAIIRALVVSVSGRTYAVPLNSVLEITSVMTHELRTVERREVLSLRGQTVPFSRLARLFGHPERPLSRHFVVIVGLAQERLGIAVDELLGQQDIVIKSLGGRLRDVRGIAGATDLGNRRTVLVLDVGALIEEVVSPERRPPGEGA